MTLPALMVLTDRHMAADAGHDLVEVVVAAVGAGAPTVLLREKDLPRADRHSVAVHLRAATAGAGATLIVASDVALARRVGADGVHLGAEDLPVATVRRLVGPDLFVGGTARDPSMARRLVHEGASYLGVGPTFPTKSKAGLPEPIGVGGVRAVASAVSVPVIAIAGITAERVDEVMAAGAWGVAVIGAISDAPDPHSATHEMMLAVAKAVEALGGAPA